MFELDWVVEDYDFDEYYKIVLMLISLGWVCDVFDLS